jgi:hypothetical protein
VKIKASCTWFHNHTAAFSAWSYAGHVEKNPYPTPKQAKKSNATAKCNFSLKQVCGSLKTATPT